jgi:hypothetical protein
MTAPPKLNARQTHRNQRREDKLMKRTGVKVSKPAAVRANQISYDPTGKYNTPTSFITAKTKVIPAEEYSPRKKAPSRRDLHRMDVRERK